MLKKKMRILSLGLSDKWIYLIFERITEFVSLVLMPTGTKAWRSQSFFFPPTLSVSNPAVLIKRNRPWNLDGPLSWFIYQVYSAPEWWLCDGYPGVGLRRASPIVLLLLILRAPSSWHQSLRLIWAFIAGARLRPLLLMNAERGCCCQRLQEHDWPGLYTQVG